MPAEGVLEAEQRVVAHVETEHLLLEREPLGLVELGVWDGDPGALPASGVVAERVCGLERGEERGDAGLVLPAALERPVDDLVEHQAQALAGMTQRVERTGLGEGLHGPLVEHERVDPPAEVVEVVEGACRLSLGDDALDQALPDVAHRRQAEHDARAAVGAGTTSLPGANSATERLTSGTSTSMPRDRHSAR